jgi:hypothetical protein
MMSLVLLLTHDNNRDTYRQEWNIVMSATDSQWAQPDVGTTPLNYTCLYRYV